jgi:hypothetical protein
MSSDQLEGGHPGVATLYLIAPDSLRSWYASFVALAPGDDVMFTGEGPELPIAPLLPRLGEPGQRMAVFLSSHATLARDTTVAASLRERGYRVVVQSNRCAALGADKFAMKAFFDASGFASPAWARADGGYLLGSHERPLVVKNRWGTQSIGILLESRGEFWLAPDEFCEDYLDGVEYSVVLYRDERGCAVFPPIWKGPTSPALVPPWRRLRLCPFPGLPADVERELRRTGRRIAEAADCAGLMEVELLLTAAGAMHVLEINPRVAGTLRISAMATGTPIFAMHKRPELRGDLTASRFAAEIPYGGEPYSDLQSNVYASSRLTVAAGSLAGLQDRLRDLDEVAADDLARLQSTSATVPGAAAPTLSSRRVDAVGGGPNLGASPNSLPYKPFGGAQ